MLSLRHPCGTHKALVWPSGPRNARYGITNSPVVQAGTILYGNLNSSRLYDTQLSSNTWAVRTPQNPHYFHNTPARSMRRREECTTAILTFQMWIQAPDLRSDFHLPRVLGCALQLPAFLTVSLTLIARWSAFAMKRTGIFFSPRGLISVSSHDILTGCSSNCKSNPGNVTAI